MISTTAEAARRLAVTKQHLAGPLPRRASPSDILAVVRDLAYVQWDPITIVAPSHIISLWNRLGDFQLSDLENLMWREKKLFEHWTPIASIVLTEDYPLYHSLMERYPQSLTKSWGSQRARAAKFLAQHSRLRRSMLDQLRRGPLQLSQFEEYVKTKRSEDGWSSGSDVSSMLFHLHMTGNVMVVGHEGNQNVWGLTNSFLPAWVEKKPLSEKEFERRAAIRAIGALGTATSKEIWYYFVRGRYENLKESLTKLEEDSTITRVRLEGSETKEVRYICGDDVPLLKSMGGDSWEPRMSLIPPFDNMLAGNDRLNRLFGFKYVREQFLPLEKRKYGTYVLPILYGSSYLGRLDPTMDREAKKLLINSVHAEPGAPKDRAVGSMISETVERFAEFLGAEEVVYTPHVPTQWKSSLR